MRPFPAGEPTCPALRMAEDGGEGGGGKLWQRISHSLGLIICFRLLVNEDRMSGIYKCLCRTRQCAEKNVLMRDCRYTLMYHTDVGTCCSVKGRHSADYKWRNRCQVFLVDGASCGPPHTYNFRKFTLRQAAAFSATYCSSRLF